MKKFLENSKDYYRIEKAIKYLKENFKRNPSLKETAEYLSLSEYHFQRLFLRWVGISPKRFIQYMTKEHTLDILMKSENLLEATNNSALSSQGRLHDLIVNCEAATPGELKSQGKGLKIIFGVHDTPFGICQIALTNRGICSLIFLNEINKDDTEYLKRKWKNAKIIKDQEKTFEVIKKIFSENFKNGDKPLSLYLKGTNFQIKVWEALLKIPSGNVTSYEDVAKLIKKPKAVRATASAVANNPISLLIPCHRVVRKSGVIHNYGWGPERKVAMLGWERAKSEKLIETN